MGESPVFVKTYDFIQWTLDVTQKFPRALRFSLTEYLQRHALDLLEYIVRATQAETPSEVVRYLGEGATIVALLRANIRVSQQKGCLTPRQLEFASERLREISNLIRAWQRKARVPATQPGAASATV